MDKSTVNFHFESLFVCLSEGILFFIRNSHPSQPWALLQLCQKLWEVDLTSDRKGDKILWLVVLTILKNMSSSMVGG